MDTRTRPAELAIDRSAGVLTITWADQHISRYPLPWLRSNCPCATCREEQRAASKDIFQLHSGALPSAEIANADLVGNYAVRLVWKDGHSTGIFTFSTLRQACPCKECNPQGSPTLF
jgi:DUF971 family protein